MENQSAFTSEQTVHLCGILRAGCYEATESGDMG